MKSNRILWNYLTVLAIMLLLAPAATVSAIGKPIREPLPFVAFAVTDTCEFDVYWEPLVDNGFLTVMNDKDTTRYVITGAFKTRLTNMETGKYIDRNISASMTQTYDSDGSFVAVLHGPFIGWFGFPGNPPLAYIKGRQVVKYDADGNLIEAGQSGQIEDLCAALAN